MGAPLPWFPFYVDAFETDEKVARLTMEQQGIYIRLLCWQWREGTVPNDSAFVGRKLSVRPTDVRRVLSICFTVAHGSRKRMVNVRLERMYAEALGKSEKARRAGQISASVRAANAERMPNGGGADVQRFRSTVQKDIQKSLDAAPEPNGNGTAKTPAPLPAPKKQPTEAEVRARWKPGERETP